MQEEKKKSLGEKHLLSFLLVLVTLGVYWQVPAFEFLEYDDMVYVTDNKHVQNGLTLEGLIWALTSMEMGFWHPITWLSLMVDSEIFGSNPGGYHLTNLLLHIASTVLLFLLLERMTKAQWRGAFVAALFALHPLHVESVAWIAERKDVLSGFFWMLSMWVYVRYTERPDAIRYMTLFFVFILGLMAKPMLVTLPCVFLLMDVWPLGRVRWSGLLKEHSEAVGTMGTVHVSFYRLIGEKLPMLCAAVAVGVVTIVSEDRFGALHSLETIPLDLRAANVFISYVWYIGKTFLPLNLAAYYTFPSQWPLWQAVGAFIFLLSIFAIVITLAAKHPYLAFGWFWYVGTLVPVIGIIKVGSYSVADRFTYIPLIGIFIMVAWGAHELLKNVPLREKILSGAGGIIVVALMVFSSLQVQYWRNTTMLFQHALDVTKNNTVMHYFMGNFLFREGNVDQAIRHYREALKIKPDFDDGHDKLGRALSYKGLHAEAIQHYQQAIRINPAKADFHYHLACSLEHLGKMDEASLVYHAALRVNPRYAEAHNNLGVIALRRKDIDMAIRHFQDALKINEKYAGAHYNLGSALAQKGFTLEAMHHFEMALRIEPNFARAHYALGEILLKKGEYDKAIAHFSEAVRINPEFEEAKYTLSSVLKLQKKKSN